MKPTTFLIFVVVLMTFVLIDTEAAPNPEPKGIGSILKKIHTGIKIGGALIDAGSSAYDLANSIKGKGRNMNRRFYVSNYNNIYPYYQKPYPQIGFIPIVLGN